MQRLQRGATAVAMAAVAHASAFAHPPLETVVLSTSVAPGTASPFGGLSPPVLNNNGRVAFRATLQQGNGVSGIWSNDAPMGFGGPSGTLSLVALKGAVAPGTNGLTFDAIDGNNVLLSDNGRTGFVGFAQNVMGVWVEGAGPLENIMLNGGVAPSVPPGTFNASLGETFLTLNAQGDGAFKASFNAPGPPGGPPTQTYTGIWKDTAFGLELAAKTSGANPQIAFTSFAHPEVNDQGLVAVYGMYYFEPGASNKLGIFVGPPGALAPAYLGGNQAPGFRAGVSLGPPSTPFGFNNSGEIAFTAGLAGPGINGSNSLSMWRGNGTTVSLVARQGDVAPGTNGATFSNLFAPQLADSGHIVFRANLAGAGVNGTNNVAIFRQSPGVNGGLELIARLGDAAPDLNGGTFSTFSGTIATNANGQVIFQSLVNAPLPAGSPIMIFGTDAYGHLRLAYRSGAQQAIGGGVMASVSCNYLPLETGGSDGARRNFNDDGQFAFSDGWSAGAASGGGIFIGRIPSAGDINGDGTVDAVDLGLLLGAWGACGASCGSDINRDGVVDAADLAILLGAWG